MERTDAVTKDNPFAAAQANGRAFETSARREALARLTEGLGTREPFLLVTGEPGTGKTTLVREAIAHWESRAVVAFVANPALTRTELLEEIALRFGASPPANASKPQLIACIERVIAETAERGRVAVIVIDDAHDVATELLDELRLLANTTVQAGHALEIALVGLTTLEARLAEPTLAPLRQRIGAQCHVRALTNKETRRYLQETVNEAGGNGPRLFPREACREIFIRSHGVPRTVNALAAEAMRLARETGASAVTEANVKAAASAHGLVAERESLTAPGDLSVKAELDIDEAPLHEPAPVIDPVPDGHTTAASEPAPKPTAAAEKPIHTPPKSNGTAAVKRPTGKPSRDEPNADQDPRVGEWVAKFIGPEEPRFGSMFELGVLSEVETVVVSKRSARGKSALETPGDASSAAPPEDGTAEPKPSNTDDVDASWSARHPRPRSQGGRMDARRPRGLGGVPIAIGLIALAAVAIVVWPGVRRILNRSSASQVAAARAGADSALASTPSKKGKSARSRAAAQKASKAADASAATANSARPSRMTLDVGTYINPERATFERDRLASETGLEAWVVDESEDGIATYRVVVGIYRTPERAQAAAALLLSRGTVTQAIAVPLPPRGKRR